MFKTINLRKIISSLVLTLGGGFLVGILSGGMDGIYQSLNTPPLSPPGAVFGIVWTILYIMMGIALYRIRILPDSKDKSAAISFFGLQLAANFIWPLLFFAMRLFCFSAVWLGILLILVSVTIIYFFRLDKVSAILMIPYLLWCVFALYLNIGVCVLGLR